MVGDREIFPAGHNQMHRPINPAIDRKVAAQRRDVRFPLVAHAHGEQVGAGDGQVGGDFKREGAERAAMLAEPFAVQINIGHQAGRLEPQKISFAGLGCSDVQVMPVPAGTAIKVLSLLRFLPAPIMRKGNRLPVAVVEARLRGVGDFARFEPPAGIEQRAFTGEQVAGKDEGENENGILAHGRIMPTDY